MKPSYLGRIYNIVGAVLLVPFGGQAFIIQERTAVDLLGPLAVQQAASETQLLSLPILSQERGDILTALTPENATVLTSILEFRGKRR